MKMLTVAALLCTIMALTRADDPEAKIQNDQRAETDLVKRMWIHHRCPFGWRRIRRRCFRFVAIPMTWARAEKYCQALGGNLASVHSFREYHRIQMMIYSIGHAHREAWIGGSDAQEERVWLWSNGKRFNYSRWCPGEPSNGFFHKQHCMQMNYSVRRCWDNDKCYRRKPSVCVKRRRW